MIDSGALTWEDRIIAQPKELRDFIWFQNMPEMNNNLRGLEQYIHAPHPKCESAEMWAVYVIDKLLTNQFVEINTAIELCHTLCPDLGGIIPLRLISFVVYRAWFFEKIQMPFLKLLPVLAALPTSSRGKTHINWLLWTKQWKMEYPGSDTGDLLSFFSKCLDELAQGDHISRDAVYEGALAYVETLRAQRAALEAQANDKQVVLSQL